MINGKQVSIKNPLDAIKAKLAFCPEDRKRDGIIGDLSIRENIALALQARRGFLHPISIQEQNEMVGCEVMRFNEWVSTGKKKKNNEK